METRGKSEEAVLHTGAATIVLQIAPATDD